MAFEQPAPAPEHRPDACLQAYMAARTEREADAWRDRLLAHADPVIDRVLARKLRLFPSALAGGEAPELEDLRGEAVFGLLDRLHALRADPQAKPIEHFEGYVATIAFHAWDDWFRAHFPEWTSLKNKLRYLLERGPRAADFAVWRSRDGHRLCGLAGQCGRELGPDQAERGRQLAAQPAAFRARAGEAADGAALTPLVEAIFQEVDGPVEIDTLVEIAARVTGIQDIAVGSRSGSDDGDDTKKIDPRGPGTSTDPFWWRTYLEQLWGAVCQLSLEQRRAFLLAAEETLELVTEGAAPLRTIAGELEMPAEELARLFVSREPPRIPLQDQEIAARFGLRAQTVAKQRYDARKHLARRLGLEQPGSGKRS